MNSWEQGWDLLKKRSRGGRLNGPCTLGKWKTSVFECSATRPNFSKRLDMML